MLSNVDTVLMYVNQKENKVYIINDGVAVQEFKYYNNDAAPIILFSLLVLLIAFLLGCIFMLSLTENAIIDYSKMNKVMKKKTEIIIGIIMILVGTIGFVSTCSGQEGTFNMRSTTRGWYKFEVCIDSLHITEVIPGLNGKFSWAEKIEERSKGITWEEVFTSSGKYTLFFFVDREGHIDYNRLAEVYYNPYIGDVLHYYNLK